MSKKFEYFGKYILLEKLATGGMAEVFLARRPGASGIGKFLAIKRILPQFADSEEFIDMFKDEAKIAINLNHSNIVSLHEFGVELDQFFIVMDYVNGRNLRQILNKMKKNSSKLSIDQIVYIVKEIASGLDHAHRCLDGTTGKPLNITHRDMSPQNVMVSFEGELKIVDFGIAKAESKMETTRAGTLKGKFGYMSPEQAEGQQVDLRTDIFSLGIILWELLTADRLFIANNEINTLKKIRDCQIPSLRKIDPNVPAELERITNKALAKDRNLRYQTAAALHRDLNRFLNRQYPDFSSRDFSVFVMTLFSEEILQVRKRQIEYAKIPFQDSTDDQSQPTRVIANQSIAQNDETNSFISSVKTSSNLNFSSNNEKFVKANTATQTETTPKQQQTHDSAVQVKSFDQEVKDPSRKVRKKGGREVLDHEKVDSALKNRIQVDVSNNPYSLEPDANKEDSIVDFNPYTKYESARYNTPRSRINTHKSTLKLFNLVIIAGLLIIGYSFTIKFFPSQMRSIIAITDPVMSPLHNFMGIERMPAQQQVTGQSSSSNKNTTTLRPAQKPKIPNLPETPKFRDVIISSTPSGAEIYINNIDTNMITPSRVEIPVHKPFHLYIKRTGYQAYELAKVDGNKVGTKIEAILEKAVVGYLDIDVSPPLKVELYINNRRVKQDILPILKHEVPANKRIVIKALDPYRNSQETAVVTLKPNQRRKVILNLQNKKNYRIPSNSRKK